MNFLSEKDGKPSAKRIAGFLGLISMVAIAIFAIIKDPGQSSNVMWPIATVTLACFGATAINNIGEGKK